MSDQPPDPWQPADTPPATPPAWPPPPAPPPGWGPPPGPPPAYGQQPYGQQPHGQPGYQPYPSPYGAPDPSRLNGFAVASLVLGVLWVFWLGSAFAVVFAFIAMSQIKRAGGKGQGLAIAGLVLGILGLAFLVIGLIGLAVDPDSTS